MTDPKLVALVKTTARRTLFAALLVIVASFIAGYLAAGSAGVRAAIVVAIVGAALSGIAIVSMLAVARDINFAMAAMLGGFVLKLVILTVAILIVRRIDDIQPFVIFFGLLALVVAITGVEMVSFMRANIPAVQPTPRAAKEPEK